MACGIKSVSFSCTMLLVGAVLCGFQQQAFGQLSPYFYDESCPSLVYVVRRVVGQAVASEPRMAASLLRLHFHDCFVNGCDASVLLDDTSSFTGEKTANPNKDSLRGFEVIDNVKTEVEKVCKGVVSCADILALAAREAVHLVQGPFWQVYYGRRDSTTASLSAANNDIPAPTSSAATLISKFQAKGLSTQDMVVLSGAHTIGQARCTTFKDRLYNFGGTGQPDSTLDKSYLASLQQQCPNSASSDNNVSPLDVQSPVKFDSAYFSNLKSSKGLLNSDQVLQSTAGDTQNAVDSYSSAPYKFFSDFGPAMIKMGNISPLTGSNGQIRQSCRAVNQ